MQNGNLATASSLSRQSLGNAQLPAVVAASNCVQLVVLGTLLGFQEETATLDRITADFAT